MTAPRGPGHSGTETMPKTETRSTETIRDGKGSAPAEGEAKAKRR
jgi:hypothetical protein